LSSPVVSVVIPVRNAGIFLDAALLSVSRQTFPDFEAVLIDDGSTDKSRELLERFASKDQRFRILSSGGLGLVKSLELGRSDARGEFLARMDADDVMHPERLRLQVEHLKSHPKISAVGSLVRIFPRGLMRQGWKRYERWINSLCTTEQIHRERFVESPFVHPSATLRSKALQEMGGYRDTSWPEDYDLWLRLLENGHRLEKIPRHLLFWRNHGEKTSFRDPRYHPDRHREMKLHFLLQGTLLDLRRVVVWGAGKNGRLWAKSLRGAGIEIECFIDVDPKKIGRSLHGVEIVPVGRARDPDCPFILGAVASPGAREEIRAFLLNAGKVEERDFLFVQ
jgi:glycosyltransferase involved in cell wall biosynthesis